jgi:hypothetical protein
MLSPRTAIAPATSATLVLLLPAAVLLVIVVLLVALGATLVATFRPALRGLGSRGSGSGARLGGLGHESCRVIGGLSRRRRGFVPARGRFGVGWLAHTRCSNCLGARPFIGSVTIGIGFALLLLTAVWARPTAATMGTSAFVHAPVLVCGRASTAQQNALLISSERGSFTRDMELGAG